MTAVDTEALAGYLDVKTPTKTKGLLGKWKAWKRRWVTVARETEGSKDAAISIKVHTSQAAAGMQQKILFAIPLTPQNVVIFRCRSSSHQFAFSVVQNQKAVLHLAGSSETQSQLWMAQLRELLWPADPLVQTEKMLSTAYDVSIVDTQCSTQAGGLGVYGYMSIRSNILIILHPHTGRVAMEWPLSLLDDVHQVEREVEEDKGKILSIVSSWKAAGQQQQEVLFYSQNCEDIVREVRNALQKEECKTQRTVSNCDILLRELDMHKLPTPQSDTVPAPSSTRTTEDTMDSAIDDKAMGSDSKNQRDSTERTTSVEGEETTKRRCKSDTNLSTRSTSMARLHQDIKTQAKYYKSVMSVKESCSADEASIHQEETPSGPPTSNLLELMFQENSRQSTVQRDFLDCSLSSTSSSSWRQSDSHCDESDSDSDYSSPASVTCDGIQHDVLLFGEPEHQQDFPHCSCPHITETDVNDEPVVQDVFNTSRRSSEASISSSHTYSTITASSSKRPSQVSITLYDDIEKLRNQEMKNAADTEGSVMPPILPPRPTSLPLTSCLETDCGSFDQHSTLSSSSSSSQDNLMDDEFDKLYQLSASITKALSQVEVSEQPQQRRWFKKVFNSKKRVKRCPKSPVNYKESFLHTTDASSPLQTCSLVKNVGSDSALSDYSIKELHRCQSETSFSSNSDSPLPSLWPINTCSNGRDLLITTPSELSYSELSDQSQCPTKQLLDSTDIASMLSARDRHKQFKSWMESGEGYTRVCDVKEELCEEDSLYMPLDEVFPVPKVGINKVVDTHHLVCHEPLLRQTSGDYTCMSPQDLVNNNSSIELASCDEEANRSPSIVLTTPSLEDRTGYLLMEPKY